MKYLQWIVWCVNLPLQVVLLNSLFRGGFRSFPALLAYSLILFLWTVADAARLRTRRAAAQSERAGLAARLGLTDLCLFPEARYSRHLSQADLHSAFQDHPGALEHFPSGSLVPPPAVSKPHANLD